MSRRTKPEPTSFMIYVSAANESGEISLRRASGPVSAQDLQQRIATVRNCFADAAVHVTAITETPYLSFLPKCAETGNCSTVPLDDVDNNMRECIG